MTPTTHFIPNFEIRSVLLMAALSVGTVMVAHAQTTPDSGTGTRAPTISAPAQNTPSPSQSTPARAAPTAQDIDAAFNRADTNKDAKLSRQEAALFPAIEQRFDVIDTNRDQFVSREEFEKALKS